MTPVIPPWVCAWFKVIHVELAKFKLEQLDHTLYSPDMSPCDFHVFSFLKNI